MSGLREPDEVCYSEYMPVNQTKLKSTLKRHGVQFAFLFGSQAEGRSISSSDLDIAVFFGQGTAQQRFQKRLNLQHDLNQLFDDPVDLQVLDDVRSLSLRHDVVSQGRLIFECNTSKRIDFELKTMRDFEEFYPFLVDYNTAYLQRV